MKQQLLSCFNKVWAQGGLRPRVLVFFTVLLLSAATHAATEYTLGSGDVINISVYEHPDLKTLARISPTGRISFPLVGEVELNGLTVGQAEVRLVELLKKGGFVKHPQVSIAVEQYHSQQVSVLGEVSKPGKYPIEGAGTIVDVLALAGGIGERGGEKIKVIRRVDKEKATTLEIDLLDFFLAGDMTKNVELSNNDIVYVPRMDQFYIYGEVQRPGIYRLERDMTIMQALSVAGGLTGRGTERGIKIKRRGNKDLVSTQKEDNTDVLQKDDVIYVKEGVF